MMGIKKILWVVVGLFGFASCQRGAPQNNTKPAITKDTLVYTYQTIKERAPDCGNKPDSACTMVKVTYPVFNDQSELNNTITAFLREEYTSGEKPDNSLQEQSKDFISSYMTDSVHKNNPDMVYSLESSATVIRQDSSLATIQVDGYMYTGGAHGSSSTRFINWNTKSAKTIYFKDLFSPGYETKLTTIAEKIFRKDEKLSDTSSLQNYFFKDEKFYLTDNFLITPVGIQFLYNEYEIKAYSEGQTTLLIPYIQIRSLLRSNTVLKQYIK